MIFEIGDVFAFDFGIGKTKIRIELCLKMANLENKSKLKLVQNNNKDKMLYNNVLNIYWKCLQMFGFSSSL